MAENTHRDTAPSRYISTHPRTLSLSSNAIPCQDSHHQSHGSEYLTFQAIQAHNLHQLSLHQDPSYLTTLKQEHAHLIGSALASLDVLDPLPQYLHARVVYETPGMATMERFETSSSYPLRGCDVSGVSFDGVCEDLRQHQQQQQVDTRDMAIMERFETSSAYPLRSPDIYEIRPFSKHEKYQVSTPELAAMGVFEPESSFEYQAQHSSLTPPHHYDQTSSTHPQPPHTPQDHNLYPQNQHLNPTYPSYPSPIDQTQTLSRIGTQFPVYASCASPSPSQVHAQEIYIAIRKAYVGSQW